MINMNKKNFEDMATIDKVTLLNQKIKNLKAMIIMEKELFLKEDSRARKLGGDQTENKDCYGNDK